MEVEDYKTLEEALEAAGEGVLLLRTPEVCDLVDGERDRWAACMVGDLLVVRSEKGIVFADCASVCFADTPLDAVKELLKGLPLVKLSVDSDEG